MASDLNLTVMDQLSREHIETPEVYDQLFESATTLEAFKNNGMVETGVDIGTDYQWMIRDALPNGPTPYQDYDVFPLAGANLFDRVHLGPKNYALTLTIPKTKLDNNMGESKLADLLGETMEAGIQQFAAGMNTDIFNIGSDPLRMIGLRQAVSDSTHANSAVYAGITRNTTTNAFWNSIYDLGTEANMATDRTLTHLNDPTSAFFIFNLFDRVIFELKQKGKNPNEYICITNMGLANVFSNNIRNPFLNVMMGDLKKADLSPVGLYHHGIPIFPDVDCPVAVVPTVATAVNQTYFLNKRTTKLLFGSVYSAGETKMGIFDWGGWKDMSPTQEIIAGNLKCRCLLVTKQPGANVMLGVDGVTVPGLIT